MDLVASSILDLTLSGKAYPPAINILHTRPIQWNTALRHIADALVQEEVTSQLPFVPFPEWVSSLEKRAQPSPREKDMTEVVSSSSALTHFVRTKFIYT